MTDVIEVVTDEHDVQNVDAAARALADVLGSQVRVLRLPDGCDVAEATRQVLGALAHPGVAAAVLRSGPEDLIRCWSVLTRASVPVLFVPDRAPALSGGITRALLPLDGSPASAAAVERTLCFLARSGVDIIVLHVFTRATVPGFWDQNAYAATGWQAQFCDHNRLAPGTRLELRDGLPGTSVVDLAREEDVSLIALGWSRTPEHGHAETIRLAVQNATVPVLLVPIDTSTSDPETYPCSTRANESTL